MCASHKNIVVFAVKQLFLTRKGVITFVFGARERSFSFANVLRILKNSNCFAIQHSVGVKPFTYEGGSFNCGRSFLLSQTFCNTHEQPVHNC